MTPLVSSIISLKEEESKQQHRPCVLCDKKKPRRNFSYESQDMALQLTLSCDLDKSQSGPTLIHSTGVQDYKIPPEVIRTLQENISSDSLSDHEEGVLCQDGPQRILDVLRRNGFTLQKQTTDSQKALWTLVQSGESSGGGGGGGGGYQPPVPQPTPGGDNDADAGGEDQGGEDEGGNNEEPGGGDEEEEKEE